MDLLLAAERPVILAGGGMNLADAHAEGLLALAEATGAAVVTTMQGKGVFPEDHPLYGWHAGSKGTGCGNALTSGADVVFAVGTRFADEATSSYRQGISFSIPPTRLIHADIDPGEIGKNYPVAVDLVGDAKAVLADTLEALRAWAHPRARGDDYAAQVKAARDTWLRAVAEFNSVDVVPVSISRFLKELRAFLDRDAIVASSSGNAQAQILQEFPFYKPRTNLTSGGFSTMGFAMPAAMGAKIALPERQVVAVVGDGDFLMTVQELATAVQYNIPIVVTVVANNYGWQWIKDLQMAALGPERVYATEFRDRQGAPISPDFTALARSFGAYAERVERPEEVHPALARAFAQGRPAVVEVIVNREQPYAGGTVAGWWDVPIPAYWRSAARSTSANDRKRHCSQQTSEAGRNAPPAHANTHLRSYRWSMGDTGSDQEADKPGVCQACHLLERALLLKEVRGAWNDQHLLLGQHLIHRLAIEVDDDVVRSADDQQRRRLHGLQDGARQVRPSAARHHGGYTLGLAPRRL